MTEDTVTVDCSRVVKNILCEALRNYAYFSRGTNNLPFTDETKLYILDIADSIEQQYLNSDKSVSLDSKTLSYCQQAINYHYDRIDHLLNANTKEQRLLMLNLLTGISTHDRELDHALIKDNLL